jgi:hypothetical protein
VTKESCPALPTSEQQSQAHPSEHLGEPGIALRAGRGLLEQGVRDRLRLEVNWLVSPWQTSHLRLTALRRRRLISAVSYQKI